jgi:DDE superfamily endonuclease
MVQHHNCKLEFLPPYSPDYNPIEYSFAVIKRALRKQDWVKMEGNEIDEEFAKIIIKVAMLALTPEIARNQFKHCYIRVPEIEFR